MDATQEALNWTRAYLEWLDGEASAEAASLVSDLRRNDAFLQAIAALRSCDRRRRAPASAPLQQELDALAAELHALEDRVMALRSAARAP